jgi:hypothetical protein
VERSNEFCQTVRSGQKRFTAVQDDVDDIETMPLSMIADALDSLGGYSMAHAFRHVAPRLIRHFVNVTVRTRQVAPAVDLQNELAERERRVSCFPDGSHIEVEQRPRRGMSRDLG